MDEGREKRAVYAEILELLIHRSGQRSEMNLDVMYEAYFPELSQECFLECARDLHDGDFPALVSRGFIKVTEKNEAQELVKEIRSQIYD